MSCPKCGNEDTWEDNFHSGCGKCGWSASCEHCIVLVPHAQESPDEADRFVSHASLKGRTMPAPKKNLNITDKEIVSLREKNGESWANVAKAAGCSIGTVRTHYNEALKIREARAAERKANAKATLKAKAKG